MIFQCYAIDPNVFETQKDFVDLFERFGASSPQRLIMATPRKHWERSLFQRLKKVSVTEKKRKRYVEFLKKLRDDKRLVRCGGNSDVNEMWLEQHKDELLSGDALGIFVSDENVDIDSQLYSWSDPVTEGPVSWQASNSSIDLTADSIGHALVSLIKVSSEFHLIDPYIWPHSGDPWRSTEPILRAICRDIQDGSGSGSQKTLTIHTSDKKAGLQSQLDTNLWWSNDITEAFPNVSLKFKVWPKDREHDRFFFTDRGGVSFSNSFQEKQDEKCEVAAISLERLRDLRRKYCHSEAEVCEQAVVTAEAQV